MAITVEDVGTDNHVDIDPSVKATGPVAIKLYGTHNRLVIGPDTTLGGGIIELRNHHSSIEIGEGCLINGQLRCRAQQTHIKIGAQTTMMMAVITLHEAGQITLGRDCMLSGNVMMDVSDMHSIVDMHTGARLNPPRDIVIGDHVWLARGVQVLKGAQIGADSVIGAGSIVSGKLPAHCVASGVPARVRRTGVTWDRKRLPWGADGVAPH